MYTYIYIYIKRERERGGGEYKCRSYIYIYTSVYPLSSFFILIIIVIIFYFFRRASWWTSSQTRSTASSSFPSICIYIYIYIYIGLTLNCHFHRNFRYGSYGVHYTYVVYLYNYCSVSVDQEGIMVDIFSDEEHGVVEHRYGGLTLTRICIILFIIIRFFLDNPSYHTTLTTQAESRAHSFLFICSPGQRHGGYICRRGTRCR